MITPDMPPNRKSPRCSSTGIWRFFQKTYHRPGKRLGVPSPPSPCRILTCSGRVFSRGSHARSDPLRAMRLAGRSLLLRKILHHLQGPDERTPVLRRPLLLPRLPGSLRRFSGQHPWPLKQKHSACFWTPTPAWRPQREALDAFSPTPRESRTTLPPGCNPPSSPRARKPRASKRGSSSTGSYVHTFYRSHGSRSVPYGRRLSGDRPRHHRRLCLPHWRYGVRSGCFRRIRPRSVRNARWGSRHSLDEIYRPRRSQRLGAARDKKGQTARLSGLFSCTLPLLKFTFSARTYSCESATSSGRR